MNFILNHYERIKLILLLLIVASFPFHYHISSVLVIAAVIVSLYKAFATRSFDIRNTDQLSAAMACYFIIECIGLTYTDRENLAVGLFTLEKHQVLILVPLIFIDFNLPDKHRKWLMTMFTASCFMASLICLIGAARSSLASHNTYFYDWEFSHDRLSQHINIQAVYLAMYLSFAVLFIISFLNERSELLPIGKKILIGLLIAYFLFIIVSLGARTITVTFTAIVIGYLFQYAYYRKSYKTLLVAALIPFVIVLVVYFNPILQMRFLDLKFSDYEASHYGSYFARFYIWQPGLDVIKENAWFGVGTGDHQQELNKKFIEYNYLEGVKNEFNMHNQYLQTWLNFGIFGFVALLIVFFLQLKRAVLTRDILYLFFLLLFLGGCLTESMLSRNKGIVFLVVFSFIFYKRKIR